MPKPELKPVVTLDAGECIAVAGRTVGELGHTGPAMLDAAIWIGDVKLDPAELRAIADWLDQWQDATLLSEVGE